MKHVMAIAVVLLLACGWAVGAETFIYGDVNGDGKIGGQDASLILKHYAGLIDCFPADPACGEGEGEGEGEGAIELVSVSAGTFTMGRTDVGDDAAYGSSDELPRHEVTLSAYSIGKYDVTNQQYCDVLNWAAGKGYLKDSSGNAWAGTGYIYGGGPPVQGLVGITDSYCNIQYSSSAFSPKMRTGLPDSTNYSMATHPVVNVSWHGSVAFCNWLSERDGLMPCYDLSTWTLTAPRSGGYRLPTEAEWERAAAWDGSKHWIYGFTSDMLTGKSRCNYHDANPDFVNPLGLTLDLYTSPVGWFNGLNISPNGNVQTVNSVSPAGCYDMSGNVWQWCQDLHEKYTTDAVSDPQGASTGASRIARGGSWYGGNSGDCRTASRIFSPNYGGTAVVGFRVAVAGSSR